MYSWQQPNWPKFTWRNAAILPAFEAAAHTRGRLAGMMAALGFDMQLQAELQATAEDTIKTSAIEGEVLSAAAVRSSVARRLGLPDGGAAHVDRDVEGVVEMLLDATKNHAAPLDEQRLFFWHRALFPTGASNGHKIVTGAWREGPIYVGSWKGRREIIHFEAPPAETLPGETGKFLAWINSLQKPTAVDSAIAHLWFVTLHPFEDGNGRISRAIADYLLARGDGISQRFYSMSSQIQRDRKAYYEILEATQKGNNDITDWLLWYAKGLTAAIDHAESLAARILEKARFYQHHTRLGAFNDRQLKVLNLMFDGKIGEEFKGAMSTAKYARIAKTSTATANRDLTDLAERDVFLRNEAGGRSTSYRLNWPPEDQAGAEEVLLNQLLSPRDEYGH